MEALDGTPELLWAVALVFVGLSVAGSLCRQWVRR